ncbi:MAG TPA: FAD-binding protein, partial [Solirubrobacterales bacterium]|nr:FAD-binding protein [Solirubrobacterales bacterium]
MFVTDFSELSISGRVATPADPDWDEVRQPWNLAVDLQPAAVALVESADDVAKVMTFAAANELRVTAQGAGHGAEALASLEGTVLIKMERMRGV